MIIVSLLWSSPMNGTEIMDGVEEKTRGWWRPTPGAIYPLLSRMAEEGTIRKVDGRYELTPRARKEFEASPFPWFRRPREGTEIVRHMESLTDQLETESRSGNDKLASNSVALRTLAKRLIELAGEESAQDSDT